MKFKIIPNEQTPGIVEHKDLNLLFEDDYNMLIKFISFARGKL